MWLCVQWSTLHGLRTSACKPHPRSRFNEITEEHSALIKQLQAAKKEFKGYENKDAELRVTIKAKKDEIAKLQAKATAADTKRAVR